jgi:hypothetical protein
VKKNNELKKLTKAANAATGATEPTEVIEATGAMDLKSNLLPTTFDKIEEYMNGNDFMSGNDKLSIELYQA